MNKKTAIMTAMFAGVLAIMPCTACFAAGDSSSAAPLQEIYSSFTAEGSDYSDYKKMMAEYYEDVTFSDALEDDRFVVTIDSSNEYMESGSWEFVQEGDYLVLRAGEEDFLGNMLFEFVIEPVGEALGMDPVLYPSYIHGLTVLNMESDWLITGNEDGNNVYRLYDAAAFEMNGIDEMYLTEEAANDYLMQASGDDSYYSLPVGKIRFAGHGNEDAMTLAIGEYGENTDLSLQSLINAVKVIQPAGYQAFLDTFTELSEMEGDSFRVIKGIDEETREYLGIDETAEAYSFYTIIFGTPS